MTDLGMEEIECTEVNIDEAKEKALNLALNKVSGTFEEQKLIDMISNLNDQHEDVIGLTGFKTEEIIYLLGIQEKDKQKMFAKSAEDEFNITFLTVGSVPTQVDKWLAGLHNDIEDRLKQDFDIFHCEKLEDVDFLGAVNTVNHD
jgi:hypothetical protein